MYRLCMGTRVASSVVTNRRVIEYKYKNKTCSAWIDLPPSRRRDFIAASGFWLEPQTLRIEPEPTGERTHPVLHYVVEQTFLSKFCSYSFRLGQPVVQLEAGDHRGQSLDIRLRSIFGGCSGSNPGLDQPGTPGVHVQGQNMFSLDISTR